MIVFSYQIHVENTDRRHYTACFNVVWVFDLVMFSFSVYFLCNMCLKLWSYHPLWPVLDYHMNMC